jgi:hypothetical protein
MPAFGEQGSDRLHQGYGGPTEPLAEAEAPGLHEKDGADRQPTNDSLGGGQTRVRQVW